MTARGLLLQARIGARARVRHVEWLLFGAITVPALAVILYLGRGTFYSIDEVAWLIDTGDFSLRDAIEPYNGHLVFIPRLLYAGLFELFGTDYLTFRILGALSVALGAGVVFAYAKPIVGWPLALAPMPVLLLFGADPLHVIHGNAFTILFAISCGIGALIALRRHDFLGDVLAYALLWLGILTYSTALPYLVGAAVIAIWRQDRWQRLWVALVPALGYGAWWVWTQQLDTSSASAAEISLWNLFVLPAWAFQTIEVVLTKLSGLGRDFAGDGSGGTEVGATLALIAVVALVWRLMRNPRSPYLWAAIGVFVALSTINDLAASPVRFPDSSRYMYPSGIALLLVGFEAVRGWRPGPRALAAVAVIAVISAAANFIALRGFANDTRSLGATMRAGMTGLELAGENADPNFNFTESDPSNALIQSWTTAIFDRTMVLDHIEFVDAHGGIGYPLGELVRQDEHVRAGVDRNLIGALALTLEPADPPASRAGCRTLPPVPDSDRAGFALDPGAAVTITSRSGGTVQLRRFADTEAVEIGKADAGGWVRLSTPPDEIPQPWQVSVGGAPVTACPRG